MTILVAIGQVALKYVSKLARLRQARAMHRPAVGRVDLGLGLIRP
ncbi:MAG: hypothetical protein LZF86_110616 [Nitrospira sp.]|nr:MAG: hypothetical protein LZF86_110616 [Nitrospira sp.]